MVLGKKPFTIVEYGAGTGVLCYDILNYLEKNNAELYDGLNYCIIEKSVSMQKVQKTLLPYKVNWHDTIADVGPINGCVVSNELLDNFPVHKVVMQDQLMEVFVDYKNDFVEVLKPAKEELKNYLKEQNINLQQSYITEVNLQALDWIKEISENLQNGFLLTIDYGFSAMELYDPKRNSGTLTCYKSHEVNYSPFTNVGEQDITVHVNFSALSHWGKKYGLATNGFTSQDHFLRSLGLLHHLRQLELNNTSGANNDALFQTKKLMEMGSKFKVLIQQKGTKKSFLTGLQFSMPLL